MIVFVLSRLTKLILLKPHLKAQMASVLATVSSEALCCGPWPDWALSHRPISYLGICNPVRGKLSRVTGFGCCWFLEVFSKESYILISVLLFRGDNSWTRLSLQLLLLWAMSCNISAGTMTSQETAVPQFKSSHEVQPSACGVLAVPTQNRLLGYWCAWQRGSQREEQNERSFLCRKSCLYHIILR